ncbi:hypothetical protein KAFR_0E00720 [Kazachstania africana CBS 2517]|uniref:Autophagy-related protein 21 n=1 Tax=Kazachstania africana (strain ATCC 22294 / BCRC 22015 / CBS 2517 / CECT 1963 / NBRC 1671 / NRRL Y-8276) TaxID=1071382 RepID=H2AV26_KAZAF|nr:hypothetical protein KAFR_0E00720 [Kazachstania africana CBS 2517]CCF58226.1 hypothetical protein KAFR_0E00720 [Kazachstania africana CBS 2517]
MRALRFNQDATCCVIASKMGDISIYNCDPFGKCFELDAKKNSTNTTDDMTDSTTFQSNDMSNLYVDQGEYIVEMLFSTSLIAVVDRSTGTIKGKKLKIINTKRRSTICELVFPSEIADVVMNRKRMCVLLENDQIYIYDISCMKPLETISLWNDGSGKNDSHDRTHPFNDSIKKSEEGKTRDRRNSVRSRIRPRITLSNEDRSILCYTSYSVSKHKRDQPLLKDVVVYDAINIKPINYLSSVHKGNIACMALSQDGKLLTTASEKGTIIRVFNTGIDTKFDGKNPLYCEFRRGSRPSNLYQLIFDRSSTYVGCVGDTGTIHIFKLKTDNNLSTLNVDAGETGEITSYESFRNKSTATDPSRQIANYLSQTIKAKIPNQNLDRDFAHINVKEGTRYCLGFPEEYINQVYLAGDDGNFRIYALPSVPGSCVLTKSSSFM